MANYLDPLWPEPKMDDNATLMEQFRRQLADTANQKALDREPGLDTGVLMQLLNPGMDLGVRTGADLPVIAPPDYKILKHPDFQLEDYLRPPDKAI